jgi:hypothetical protein
MFKKNFFIVLILFTLLLLGVPTASYAQQGGTGENFIFVNYIGQELFLDLDDVNYTVPGTNTMPGGGRLALALAPGEHKYAANVPGVRGSAGEFTLVQGGYVAKGARLDKTAPVVDRNGILLEKPQDIVFLFDFDPFAAPAQPAPVVDTWQPVAAAPGKGSIAWINSIGDEVTVDLNGQIYKVPPLANTLPGRLQIDVSPGNYRYTASVPNGSLNADLALVPGQVVGLTLSANPLPEPEYDVGEEFDFTQPVEMKLFQEDLTGRAVTAATPQTQPQVQPAAAPGASPATGEGVAPAAVPAASEGITVKNYAGETLIFTINNQAYPVPNNDQLLIPLPAGNYSYTASRPSMATSGVVDLLPGQNVELSVAINFASNLLSVYKN